MLTIQNFIETFPLTQIELETKIRNTKTKRIFFLAMSLWIGGDVVGGAKAHTKVRITWGR